jgi:hypothetical protein
MHYRKIWENFNNTKIPDNHEIHHIDGNRSNNCITNLLLVSIEEHLEIHRNQEDWGAVHAILVRMCGENRQGISEAASKSQKKRLEENRHNFQIMTNDRRTEISKTTMHKRIRERGVAFLGIEDTVENSRKAGLIAAEKKAGFLNTESDNHGSKHVKNTCWWTNSETGERVRSKTAPSEQWKRGMLK